MVVDEAGPGCADLCRLTTALLMEAEGLRQDGVIRPREIKYFVNIVETAQNWYPITLVICRVNDVLLAT